MKVDERNRRLYVAPDVVRHYASSSALQPAERVILDLISGELGNARFLDIGVGGGRTTVHVGPRVKRYVGLDYSPTMLAAASARFQKFGYEFVLGDARRLPFADSIVRVARCLRPRTRRARRRAHGTRARRPRRALGQRSSAGQLCARRRGVLNMHPADRVTLETIAQNKHPEISRVRVGPRREIRFLQLENDFISMATLEVDSEGALVRVLGAIRLRRVNLEALELGITHVRRQLDAR